MNGASLNQPSLSWTGRCASMARRDQTESASRLSQIGRLGKQFLAILTLSLAGVCAQAIEVGDTLVIDNLTTIDGQTITHENLEGKHVVVQVWATWCPFCHRQNMNLVELVKRTEGLPLQVIGLSIDRKPEAVPPYVEKHGLNFPVAMMTPALEKAIGKRQGIPELYVVDPSGKVVQKDYGEMIDLDVWDLVDYVKPK